MDVIEVTPQQYRERFAGNHVFNSEGFMSLNAHKCLALKHLLFVKGGKARFGLVLGDRGDVYASPWSAPFGGFDYTRAEGVEMVWGCVEALRAWAGKPVRLTLPPAFYDPAMAPVFQAALVNAPGVEAVADLNYHYDLRDASDIEGSYDRNTRNKLRASMKQGFAFERLKATPQALARAYAVVAANHAALGYPLRMTLGQVVDTSAVVPVEVFVVTLDGDDVAGAIVYHTTPSVRQLIYWGDDVERRQLRAMNFMAWNVMRAYREGGVAHFDLGPASEDGVPAMGLCEFKQGLGCLPSLKHTFTL